VQVFRVALERSSLPTIVYKNFLHVCDHTESSFPASPSLVLELLALLCFLPFPSVSLSGASRGRVRPPDSETAEVSHASALGSSPAQCGWVCVVFLRPCADCAP
jgi:hypothetical protein